MAAVGIEGLDTSLIELLGPPLASSGFELVDVRCTGVGSPAATVQVLVDRAEDHPLGGRIDLDGVSAATRLVDQVLETADPVPGAYTLEVSSPGLERPLRTPAHFRRALGTRVHVKTRPSAAGDRRAEGVLRSADEEGTGSVTIDGRVIAYVDIDRAHTVFEWASSPKPGKGSGKSRPTAHKQASGQPLADQLPGGTR